MGSTRETGLVLSPSAPPLPSPSPSTLANKSRHSHVSLETAQTSLVRLSDSLFDFAISVLLLSLVWLESMCGAEFWV